MPDHRRKFAPTYKDPYVVKKAFSEGALILADMDRHDFNMPTNSDAVIQYFAWRSLSVHLIYLFLCQQKRKEKRNKNKIYLCKKVDRKPERVVYVKGEPKEKEREKIQKVYWKPEREVYAKGK